MITRQTSNMNNQEYIKIISCFPQNNIHLGYEYEIQKGADFNDYAEKKHKPKKLPKGFNVSWDPICIAWGQSGWEIRSIVAPLNFHRALWKKLASENDVEQGNLVRNGAGIHVHIENSERTRDNIHKVFHFLHNAEAEQLRKIGGRCVDQFVSNCRQLKDIPKKDIKKEVITREGYLFSGHYGIINTESPKTFEMRLFAARPHLLIPALEAADSLCRLSEEVDDINLQNWHNFTSQFIKYRGINELIKQAA